MKKKSKLPAAQQSIEEKIVLNYSEQEQIRNIDNLMVKKKDEIFLMTLQLNSLKTRLDNSVLDFNSLQRNLFNKTVDCAKSHGINIDDKGQCNWNFDTNTMTFTQCEPNAPTIAGRGKASGMKIA